MAKDRFDLVAAVRASKTIEEMERFLLETYAAGKAAGHKTGYISGVIAAVLSCLLAILLFKWRSG